MTQNFNITLSSGETLSIQVVQPEIKLDKLDIMDIIELIKNNTVYPCWRIYVLYHDETINYQIPNEDILMGGSYSENYQDGQRRSLSFSLYNEEEKYEPNINGLWANTRLRLDRGFTLSDGTEVWIPSGIFVISQLQKSQELDRKLVQVTAKDKFSIFEDSTGSLETSYEIPVGSKIDQVISSILLTNDGTGYPFDGKEIIYHASFKDKVTQTTISKSAGETFGSILLELATQLSAEIFYNSNGNLVLIPTYEASLDLEKPLLFDYNINEGDTGALGISFDMNAIVNRIIVIGSSLTGGVVTATSVNDNPESPLCYQRIGYRTGNIINDSNITSMVLANERAQYELRKQLVLKSSVNITVLYNPFLSVNNLIALTSEYFHLLHDKFLIQSISCPIDYSGSMNITVSNLENFAVMN